MIFHEQTCSKCEIVINVAFDASLYDGKVWILFLIYDGSLSKSKILLYDVYVPILIFFQPIKDLICSILFVNFSIFLPHSSLKAISRHFLFFFVTNLLALMERNLSLLIIFIFQINQVFIFHDLILQYPPIYPYLTEQICSLIHVKVRFIRIFLVF